jgi:hypothetical protein
MGGTGLCIVPKGHSEGYNGGVACWGDGYLLGAISPPDAHIYWARGAARGSALFPRAIMKGILEELLVGEMVIY